jgi:hypothetical protein
MSCAVVWEVVKLVAQSGIGCESVLIYAAPAVVLHLSDVCFWQACLKCVYVGGSERPSNQHAKAASAMGSGSRQGDRVMVMGAERCTQPYILHSMHG